MQRVDQRQHEMGELRNRPGYVAQHDEIGLGCPFGPETGFQRHAAVRQRPACGAAHVHPSGSAQSSPLRHVGGQPLSQRAHGAAQLGALRYRRFQECHIIGIFDRRDGLDRLPLGQPTNDLACDQPPEFLDQLHCLAATQVIGDTVNAGARSGRPEGPLEQVGKVHGPQHSHGVLLLRGPSGAQRRVRRDRLDGQGPQSRSVVAPDGVEHFSFQLTRPERRPSSIRRRCRAEVAVLVKIGSGQALVIGERKDPIEQIVEHVNMFG